MSSKRKGGGKGGGKKSGSYEVGYAKPPEHSKFKPGVSGNPQGRPRGAPNRNRSQVEQNRLRDIIAEEAERMVTIQTPDGKTKKITTTRALIRATNLNGIKGQQRAQRHAIGLISETQRIAQAEREETFARWAKYKDDWSIGDPVAREAALPHPDHVKLDTDTFTVTIAGPALQHERAAWRRWTAIRVWVLDELKELQGFEDPEFKELAIIVKIAEETVAILDLALGGARPVMNFLERLDVADIEAKCQKKRRRHQMPYLCPRLLAAIRDRVKIEKGKW